MPNSRAEAFASASMGNVGVGFDILGLAFREPGDSVIVESIDGPGVSIKAIEGDGGVLPLEPERNTAAVAVMAYLKMIDQETQGVALTIRKGLPLSSGLGSSAASAVAGVVAVNALFGLPLKREELLPACLEGEALVSGYHADNVGPSLLGGITLITGTQVEDIQRLPVPDEMHLALITPAYPVQTIEARAVLPKTISLQTMVAQTGAVARLIDALHRGDVRAAAAAMEQDHVIEPARAHLFPLLDEVRKEAKREGAAGLVVSGAGPTLCAICETSIMAQVVASAMQRVYATHGIESKPLTTRVDPQGARVIDVL